MQVRMLERHEMSQLENFYRENGTTLRYPRQEWAMEQLKAGILSVVGVFQSDQLIATSWHAYKTHNIYLSVEKNNLVLRNDGSFWDGGGWVTRKDVRGKGLLPLLAAASFTSFFIWRNLEGNPPLWGRMVAKNSEHGVPEFWRCLGVRVTGLDYLQLMSLPFGELESAILDAWPKEPIPLADLPVGLWESNAGLSASAYVTATRDFLTSIGCPEVSDRFAPTSANRFVRGTRASVEAAVGDIETWMQMTAQRFGAVIKRP